MTSRTSNPGAPSQLADSFVDGKVSQTAQDVASKTRNQLAINAIKNQSETAAKGAVVAHSFAQGDIAQTIRDTAVSVRDTLKGIEDKLAGHGTPATPTTYVSYEQMEPHERLHQQPYIPHDEMLHTHSYERFTPTELHSQAPSFSRTPYVATTTSDHVQPITITTTKRAYGSDTMRNIANGKIGENINDTSASNIVDMIPSDQSVVYDRSSHLPAPLRDNSLLDTKTKETLKHPVRELADSIGHGKISKTAESAAHNTKETLKDVGDRYDSGLADQGADVARSFEKGKIAQNIRSAADTVRDGQVIDTLKEKAHKVGENISNDTANIRQELRTKEHELLDSNNPSVRSAIVTPRVVSTVPASRWEDVLANSNVAKAIASGHVADFPTDSAATFIEEEVPYETWTGQFPSDVINTSPMPQQERAQLKSWAIEQEKRAESTGAKIVHKLESVTDSVKQDVSSVGHKLKEEINELSHQISDAAHKEEVARRDRVAERFSKNRLAGVITHPKTPVLGTRAVGGVEDNLRSGIEHVREKEKELRSEINALDDQVRRLNVSSPSMSTAKPTAPAPSSPLVEHLRHTPFARAIAKGHAADFVSDSSFQDLPEMLGHEAQTVVHRHSLSKSVHDTAHNVKEGARDLAKRAEHDTVAMAHRLEDSFQRAENKIVNKTSSLWDSIKSVLSPRTTVRSVDVQLAPEKSEFHEHTYDRFEPVELHSQRQIQMEPTLTSRERRQVITEGLSSEQTERLFMD